MVICIKKPSANLTYSMKENSHYQHLGKKVDSPMCYPPGNNLYVHNTVLYYTYQNLNNISPEMNLYRWNEEN